MEQKKKQTNEQLTRRIKNAIVHVDKTKGTQSVRFADKGVKLDVNEDYAVISFGYSKVVYDCITASGISRPYLYTKRVIEIANETATTKSIKTDGGYSFKKLLEVLKAKEDETDYNIVTYYDWFVFNVFQPLYGIAEDEVSSFLVYEDYIHNLARNMVILSEKENDMTNKEFIQKTYDSMNAVLKELNEYVLFHKKTDEEIAKENMEAVMEQEQEQAMEAQINEG